MVGSRQQDRKSDTWEVEGVLRWRTLVRCDEEQKMMTEVCGQPGKAVYKRVVLNRVAVVVAAAAVLRTG